MSEVPPDAPINLGGVGDIDMYPQQTWDAAKVIFQAADAFGTLWAGLSASIWAEEQQLGRGRLGAEFRVNYNALEAGLKPATNNVAPNFRLLGYKGGRGVHSYVEADGRLADRFASLV